MFKSYFKIAFRNLIRHKVFSLINIVGLAVGMGSAILLFLWITDELSYDRFHKNAESIYLVYQGDTHGSIAVTSKLLGPALKQEVPEVKQATYFVTFPESHSCIIRSGEHAFEEQITVADSSFLNFFSFPVKEGDPSTALSDPASLVMTEEFAHKYFGAERAVGKTLQVSAFGQQLNMKISAVLKTIPQHSHIQCGLIFPNTLFQSLGIKEFGWQSNMYHTYIRLGAPLRAASDIDELSSRIKSCVLRHDPNQPSSLYYSLLPLTRIHLYGTGIKFLSTTGGDIKYVQILTAVAVIILLIAAFNYVNLSTALSLKRTGEVGLRKTVGANRSSLLLQFFGESMLMAIVALGFALLFASLLLPVFNMLSGKELTIHWSNASFIGMVMLVVLFTGLASGFYPALFLSSFTPIQMLKGKLKINSGSLILRKGLVVFQFALSIIIAICTIAVSDQLSFIRTSSLGFNKENILCIRCIGETNNRYEGFKNEIQKNLDVISVSRSDAMNMKAIGNTFGVQWQGKPANQESQFWILHSDFELASTYKFEMLQGRYYSDQFPSDSTSAYVVNESAAKIMNFKSPIGEEIRVWGRPGKIIGVTKDFHFDSFHSAIEPLIVRIPDRSDQNIRFSVMSLRFKAGTQQNTLAYVQKVWGERMQGIPMKFYFFDDAINAQYNSEARMGSIFNCFAFLSIVLACLGLFGLASLSAQQRTKEVGVRKVLGASLWNVTFNLSKEFITWVALSNLLAWPVAYYIIQLWLRDFAYRMDVTILPFLFAGVSALAIALLTVSWQAIRAATANPVEALRYE